MNDTILKFGYPDTLIKEYDNWVILLRLEQITLGSLIIAYKSDITSLADVSKEGYLELRKVIVDIEMNISKLFGMDKINYMALMMVDKEVHFHVIPRYSEDQYFDNHIIKDNGWPKLPDLVFKNDFDTESLKKLKLVLVESFNR